MLKKIIVSLVLSTIWISFAHANPQHGQVVAGQVAIQHHGLTTTIQQTTDKAIIDWRSFNIADNEATRIQQPTAQALLLNRILDQHPSTIVGHLTANGRIILINPAGIVFGKHATVDAAGLIATTAAMSNEDFLAGRYQFTRPLAYPDSRVINEGKITIKDQGLVALVAPGVENNGMIQAHLGRVALGSGTQYTLDLYGDELIHFTVGHAKPRQQAGIQQKGRIIADGGHVQLTAAAASQVVADVINMKGVIRANTVSQHEGVITLSATNGAVKVSGELSAQGEAPGQQGGRIDVLGQHIALTDQAHLNASGQHGGGRIRIGGDFQGKGHVPKAQATFVAPDTWIVANAIDNGHGGRIIVWSDNTTDFAGHAEARGGNHSGDGGFIEVSGRHQLTMQGLADLRAPYGEAGELWLDPGSITIIKNTVGDQAGPNTFTDSYINNQLALSSVTVTTAAANNGERQTLTLASDAALAWSSPHTLTLIGDEVVTINGSITSINPDSQLNIMGELMYLNGPITVGTFSRTGTSMIAVGQSGAVFSDSVQDAINVAYPDDTITIAAGTYNERLNLGTMGSGVLNGQIGALTLTGVSQNNTIIQSNWSIDAPILTVPQTGVVTLNNLQLYKGFVSTNGAGIYNDGGQVTLNNVSVHGSLATNKGGGIYNDGGTLTLNNTTIDSNTANSKSDGNGAGIYNNNGNMTLNDSVIANNWRGDGGGSALGLGIYTTATDPTKTVSINRTTIRNNGVPSNTTLSAVVLGMYVSGVGSVSLTDSTIKDNTLNTGAVIGISAAGLFYDNTTASPGLTITRCTFSNNQMISTAATVGVGALYMNQGWLTVTDSTFAMNYGRDSSAIYYANVVSGNATIKNSTFFNNGLASQTTATAIRNESTTNAFTFQNTVISDTQNSSNGELFGAFSTLGSTFVRTFSSGVATMNTASSSGNDTIGSGPNPNLGALADNGGYTYTNAILEGSPLINTGDNSAMSSTDQRGITRGLGNGTTDIGAYEYGGFIVNTTADDADASLNGQCATTGGQCSVRAAFTEANYLGDRVEIRIPSNTYTLNSVLPLTNSTINLNVVGTGTDAQSTILTGASGLADSLISVNATPATSVQLTLSGLTLQQGNNASAAVNGGAINLVTQTNLTLSNSIISNNNSTLGGGLFVGGASTVTVTDTLFQGNTADQGGAIYLASSANLMMQGSTIATNTARTGGQGGGLFNNGAVAAITNSTFSNNTASSLAGGAIYNNNSGNLTLTNATITANTAATEAGGIVNVSGSTASLRNTLVANNLLNGSVTDLSGAFTSLGNNLIGNVGTATGFTHGVNNDLVGGAGNPTLDPLVDDLTVNSGFMPTHRLLPTSPAIDAGTSTSAPSTDQRGISRGGSNGAIDIGAIEFNTVTWTIPSGQNGALVLDGTSLTLVDTDSALATALLSSEFGLIDSLIINTPANNYRLRLDFRNGDVIPQASTLQVVGNSGFTNTLQLRNGTVDSVQATVNAARSGQVVFNSHTVSYSSIDTVADFLLSGQRQLNASLSAASYTLTDDNYDNNKASQWIVTGGQTVHFAHPTSGFIIQSTVNDDTLNVSDVESDLFGARTSSITMGTINGYIPAVGGALTLIAQQGVALSLNTQTLTVGGPGGGAMYGVVNGLDDAAASIYVTLLSGAGEYYMNDCLVPGLCFFLPLHPPISPLNPPIMDLWFPALDLYVPAIPLNFIVDALKIHPVFNIDKVDPARLKQQIMFDWERIKLCTYPAAVRGEADDCLAITIHEHSV